MWTDTVTQRQSREMDRQDPYYGLLEWPDNKLIQ